MNAVLDPNAVRFDPRSGQDHVESYFLKANEPNGERALWIKSTIYRSSREPTRALAEGWAIAFDKRGGLSRNIAVKHVVPFSSASFSPSGLDVRCSFFTTDGGEEGISITPGKTTGRI